MIYNIVKKLEVIDLKGSDAASFLENLTTQSVVQKSQRDQVSFHCILDPKGKIRFQFYVIPIDSTTHLRLCLEEGFAAELAQHLDMLIFAEDVELSQDQSWILHLEGDDLWKDIRSFKPWNCIPHLSKETSRFFYSRFTSYPGLSILLDNQDSAEEALTELRQQEAFNIPEVIATTSSQTWTQLCSLAGFPEIGQVKGELFNHVGLFSEYLSETKGCYPGQEIVTRINQIGQSNKAYGLSKSKIESKHKQVEIQIPDHEGWCGIYKVSDEGFVKGPIHLSALLLRFSEDLYSEGLHLFHQGEQQKAIDTFHFAIEMNPGNSDAYEALGVSYERLEKLDLAIQTHKQFAKLSPNSIMAHANLSRLYMLKGWIDKAEDEQNIAREIHFKESANASQSDVQALEVAQAQLNSQKEARKQMFEKVLGIDPEDDIALFGLGKFYQDKKEPTEALKYLEKLLDIKPDYAAAYPIIVKAYIALENWTAAKTFIDSGKEICQSQGAMVPLKQLELQVRKLPV